jgi:hypothetical protein
MTVEELAMNWWTLAGGLMALICTAGHAVAGWSMFYRPIHLAITNDLHAGVFRGMWRLITINFALSALALFVLGAYGRQDAVAWLIAAQFAGYAARRRGKYRGWSRRARSGETMGNGYPGMYGIGFSRTGS